MWWSRRAGVAAAFGLNAASFLLDVVVLATLRVGPSPRVPRAPRQIRDGIEYVRHTPALRTAMLTLAVIATFGFTVQVSVPILAREGLGGGPGTLGALFTAVTAGGLLGTLLFAARGGSGPRTLGRCAGAMAGALLVTALAPGPTLALVGLAGRRRGLVLPDRHGAGRPADGAARADGPGDGAVRGGAAERHSRWADR